jgi:hypothetical protein
MSPIKRFLKYLAVISGSLMLFLIVALWILAVAFQNQVRRELFSSQEANQDKPGKSLVLASQEVQLINFTFRSENLAKKNLTSFKVTKGSSVPFKILTLNLTLRSGRRNWKAKNFPTLSKNCLSPEITITVRNTRPNFPWQ